MQDPFVTIIIPTCNRPFLLKHCIEHVLTQPYPRKEVIVVDSSSNDESESVVAHYPEVISVRIRGQRLGSGERLADDGHMEPGGPAGARDFGESTQWRRIAADIHRDLCGYVRGGRPECNVSDF